MYSNKRRFDAHHTILAVIYPNTPMKFSAPKPVGGSAGPDLLAADGRQTDGDLSLLRRLIAATLCFSFPVGVIARLSYNDRV